MSQESTVTQPESAPVAIWLFIVQIIVIAVAIMVPSFDTANALAAGGIRPDVGLLDAPENKLRQVGYMLSMLAMGAGGALLVFARRHEIIGSPRTLLLILASLAFVVFSILWSDVPSHTFRRLSIFVLFCSGAYGVGRSWQTIHLLWMVVLISASMALIGLLAEASYGTLLSSADYRFSGLLHPNKQALSCAMLAIASFALWRHYDSKIFLVVALAACVLVWMTRSRGATLACAVGVSYFVFLLLPFGKKIASILVVGLLLGCGITYLSFDSTSSGKLLDVAKMGRKDALADPTKLTGRIPIWQELIEDIKKKPVLGYGYSGFFTEDRIRRLSFIHNWEFGNAHSVYLEALLGFGIVGFVLGISTFGSVLARGHQIFYQHRDIGLAFVLAVLAIALVNGLTESIFLSVGYEFLVLLIGCFMIAHRAENAPQESLA